MTTWATTIKAAKERIAKRIGDMPRDTAPIDIYVHDMLQNLQWETVGTPASSDALLTEYLDAIMDNLQSRMDLLTPSWPRYTERD